MDIDHQDPNVRREMGVNPNRSVAVVGLLDPQENILLVRTKRFPDHWQPLGGGMDPTDATPIDTLTRELTEETSLELPSEAFHFEMSTDYDFGSGQIHFYTAQVPGGLSIQFDPGEVVESQWISIKSALSQRIFPATKKFLIHLMNRNGLNGDQG